IISNTAWSVGLERRLAPSQVSNSTLFIAFQSNIGIVMTMTSYPALRPSVMMFPAKAFSSCPRWIIRSFRPPFCRCRALQRHPLISANAPETTDALTPDNIFSASPLSSWPRLAKNESFNGSVLTSIVGTSQLRNSARALRSVSSSHVLGPVSNVRGGGGGEFRGGGGGEGETGPK